MNGEDREKYINISPQYFFEKLIDERCDAINDRFESEEKINKERFDARDKALLLAQSEAAHKTQTWVAITGFLIVIANILITVFMK